MMQYRKWQEELDELKKKPQKFNRVKARGRAGTLNG